MFKLLATLTCSLLLTLPPAPEGFHNREWNEQEVAMPPSHPIDLAQNNQAPAPFGRYTETINGVTLEMVRVPTGSFLMGSNQSPNAEEKPAHKVNVKSFYLGQYEITRQQWNVVADLPQVNRALNKQFIGTLLGFEFGPSTPAGEVRWEEAMEFCERLSRRTGKTYRLPSEAEWEYACRAGTQTEFSWGDQPDYNLASFRNVAAGDPPSRLLPAGSKGYSNAWGFFDMHGNVAEWCSDVEHSNYVGAPSDGSAWLQGGNQNYRVIRGGFYGQRIEFGRSAARSFQIVGLRASNYGLRVALEAVPVLGAGRVAAASAASYSDATLARESIAALFGANLASQAQAAASLPLPTTLAEASITIKDSQGSEHLTSLFFASPDQINFQVPSGLPAGPASIYAVKGGQIHSTGVIEITLVAPGLFVADASGQGLAAAVALRVRANGEEVYEPAGQFDPVLNRFVAMPIEVSNPAEQVFLLLFGTGFRHRSALSNVKATVGGVDAEVLFAGAQGDLVGLDQANLRLSQALAGRGQVAVSLTADGKAANTVLINIK